MREQVKCLNRGHSARVKFLTIAHLPWSDGVDAKTDRVFAKRDIRVFKGREVVVTEKMDGENISMYRDYIHARSLDSRNHSSRNWVRNLHAKIAHDIPLGWRICGENLYARHSIAYRGLPSFFLVFAIYNEKSECLAWDETVSYASLLGLDVVPVLYLGDYDEERIRACYTGLSAFGNSMQEGYVVRLAGKYPWSKHRSSIGKFVRKGHVQTTSGWMHRIIVQNEMMRDSRQGINAGHLTVVRGLESQ